MEKISSNTTVFRKKYLPAISAICVIVSIICILVTSISIHYFTIPLFGGLIFIYAYLVSFRILQEVYMHDDFLIVKDEKIYLSSVISVRKISHFRYEVFYLNDNGKNSFIFMVDSFSFKSPSFINKINKFAKP